MFNLWDTYLLNNGGAKRNKLLREELCGTDANAEQYEMFRYTSIEDLEAVYMYRQDKRLNDITRTIKQGHWKTFLNTYRVIPHEAHFILLASYRYADEPRLSAKEVATAFYFLSMAIDDPGFEVGKPRKHYLEKDQWGALPKNEQVAICIHIDQLNKTAIDIIEGTIFDQESDKEFACSKYENVYEFCSASILTKTTFQNNKDAMTINFGFPTRREYIDAIFNGQNPYALLTPYSKSKIQYIHGVPLEKSSAWASRHDNVHLVNRFMLIEQHYGPRYWNEFKQVILALENLYESRPPIQCALIEQDFPAIHLDKNANADDLATRLIDELLITYLDGVNIISWFDEPDANTWSREIASTISATLEAITEVNPGDLHREKAFDSNNLVVKAIAQATAQYLILSALEPIVFPALLQRQSARIKET